ncbi:dienelactone hydrolase family protein [Sphingobacterium sp.]|uniref:dienelactone hydrolase family protein n=1 Tax=Sphingobacterium sp. TaxID=341027 RepID=UPI0031DA1E48
MKTVMTLFMLTMVTMTTQAQQLKQISYRDGEQKLNGMVTGNTAKTGPGVLILPAWKGIDNEAKQAALQLEKEGYIAFIADIYGEGNIPLDNTAASKIAGHYKTDYKAYQHRIALALEQLKKAGADPKKIAIIGYCFGGTGALEAARADLPVNAVVSIHGGLSKAADRPNGAINAKILIEHPAADKSVSKEDYDGLVNELNGGKADWQIITYANSGHTFTNPESAEYNPVMAKRAWDHTLLFLKEVLN